MCTWISLGSQIANDILPYPLSSLSSIYSHVPTVSPNYLHIPTMSLVYIQIHPKYYLYGPNILSYFSMTSYSSCTPTSLHKSFMPLHLTNMSSIFTLYIFWYISLLNICSIHSNVNDVIITFTINKSLSSPPVTNIKKGK